MGFVDVARLVSVVREPTPFDLREFDFLFAVGLLPSQLGGNHVLPRFLDQHDGRRDVRHSRVNRCSSRSERATRRDDVSEG